MSLARMAGSHSYISDIYIGYTMGTVLVPFHASTLCDGHHTVRLVVTGAGEAGAALLTGLYVLLQVKRHVWTRGQPLQLHHIIGCSTHS